MKTPTPAELPAVVEPTEADAKPRTGFVTFHRDYDHTWPSRSMTAYKKGWSGRVKASVLDAAVPDYATLDAGTDS